jgi:hypothetical protein
MLINKNSINNNKEYCVRDSNKSLGNTMIKAIAMLVKNFVKK